MSGRNLNVDAWIGKNNRAALDHHGHGHDHGHEKRVASFTLTIDQPIDWQAFSLWLRKLRIQRGDNLLRIKGILNLAEEDRPVALHGVHHILHAPTVLRAWPWEDKKSRIVFVTCDLDRADVESGLRSAIGMAEAAPVASATAAA